VFVSRVAGNIHFPCLYSVATTSYYMEPHSISSYKDRVPNKVQRGQDSMFSHTRWFPFGILKDIFPCRNLKIKRNMQLTKNLNVPGIFTDVSGPNLSKTHRKAELEILLSSSLQPFANTNSQALDQSQCTWISSTNIRTSSVLFLFRNNCFHL
jgi:hypothetical protein